MLLMRGRGGEPLCAQELGILAQLRLEDADGGGEALHAPLELTRLELCASRPPCARSLLPQRYVGWRVLHGVGSPCPRRPPSSPVSILQRCEGDGARATVRGRRCEEMTAHAR